MTLEDFLEIFKTLRGNGWVLEVSPEGRIRLKYHGDDSRYFSPIQAVFFFKFMIFELDGEAAHKMGLSTVDTLEITFAGINNWNVSKSKQIRESLLVAFGLTEK